MNPADLPPLKCNGCRACCLGDTITLMPQDNPALFKTKLVDGKRQLLKGKDGNCIYLGKRGCQIYGRQPRMCATYDCRKIFLALEAAPAGALEVRLADDTKQGLKEGQRRVLALRAERGAS